jgi:hypothetical protein
MAIQQVEATENVEQTARQMARAAFIAVKSVEWGGASEATTAEEAYRKRWMEARSALAQIARVDETLWVNPIMEARNVLPAWQTPVEQNIYFLLGMEAILYELEHAPHYDDGYRDTVDYAEKVTAAHEVIRRLRADRAANIFNIGAETDPRLVNVIAHGTQYDVTTGYPVGCSPD